MPRRREQAAFRRRELTWDELLDLTIGSEPGGRPAFAKDQERRAVYFEHRDRLIGRCQLGDRPQAYWQYEAPAELVRDPRHNPYRPTGEMARLFNSGGYTCLPWDAEWLAWRERCRTFREARWAWILAHDLRDGEAAAIAAARRDAAAMDARELGRAAACARASKVDPPTGQIRARPEAARAKKSLADVRAFAVEFGLTPSARARMHVPEPVDDLEDSPFDV